MYPKMLQERKRMTLIPYAFIGGFMYYRRKRMALIPYAFIVGFMYDTFYIQINEAYAPSGKRI